MPLTPGRKVKEKWAKWEGRQLWQVEQVVRSCIVGEYAKLKEGSVSGEAQWEEVVAVSFKKQVVAG